MNTDPRGSDDASDPLVAILMNRADVDDPESVDDFLQFVAGAAAIEAEANGLLRTTIASARTAGATWQSIGATLGMSKQAAQKRFAPPAAPRHSELDPNERILGPTTSFDEMQELNLAGRYGWHSVAVGTNYHRVVRSHQHWEHTRVTLSPAVVRQLCADGWEVIGSGFPYTYLKRATGLPALAEYAT